MFEVSPNGSDRLDIALSGKLNSEDMKTALDALVRLSQDIENGRMLYRIDDFDFPTFGAIGVELARLPGLFRLIRRFERIAVLTEKRWIRTASELEGLLIPGLSIRAFDRDDEASAEAWLSQ